MKTISSVNEKENKVKIETSHPENSNFSPGNKVKCHDPEDEYPQSHT